MFKCLHPANNIPIKYTPQYNVGSSQTGVNYTIGDVEMITHIVPEWYLLTVYMLIKMVPSHFLGLMLFVLSMSLWLQLCNSAFNGVLPALQFIKPSNHLNTTSI